MGELAPRNNDLFQKGNYAGWSYSEDIADEETSDPIKIEPTGRGVTYGSVALICGSNTGKVQVTLDTYALIDAETATWIDWDKGEVTGSQLDVFAGPITAIRGVSVSGAVTLKVLI